MYNYLELRKEELKKRGNKGFTLMEMLIVVAIIAVLIAIAIPVFTSQLENSREATDAANIRSAYAEITTKAISSPGAKAEATVKKQQAQAGWQNTSIGDIAGVPVKTDSGDNINSTTDTKIEYVVEGDNAGKVLIDGKEAKTSFTS